MKCTQRIPDVASGAQGTVLTARRMPARWMVVAIGGFLACYPSVPERPIAGSALPPSAAPAMVSEATVPESPPPLTEVSPEPPIRPEAEPHQSPPSPRPVAPTPRSSRPTPPSFPSRPIPPSPRPPESPQLQRPTRPPRVSDAAATVWSAQAAGNALAGIPAGRLAILTAKPLRDRGYSDLLTARFSAAATDGLELVERDQLDAIFREFELSALLGGEAAASQRLKLGRLLGADTLLLLSPIENDAAAAGEAPVQNGIRLVLADTRTGARLTSDGFPDSGDPDANVDRIVGVVGQALGRYPNGVEQIIGLSPFLSRCLTHAYDAYQTSCASWLAHVLAQQPGVAVLEIDEARAIGEELRLTSPEGTGRLEQRVVPVLVSGEFTATRQSLPGKSTEHFDVTVTMRRQADTEQVRRTRLTHDQLLEFLSIDLPAKVLRGVRGDAAAGGFDAETQFRWLVGEADRFARIGMWEQAIGLREAALLLRPDDADTRFRLIVEYRIQMLRRFPLPKRFADIPPDEEIREEYRRRIAYYPMILSHLETMIRNRLVRAEEILCGEQPGIIPLRGSRPAFFSYTVPGIFALIPNKIIFDEYDANHQVYRAETHYQKLGKEELEPCYALQADFMERVFPLIPDLPTNFERQVRHRYAQIQRQTLMNPRRSRELDVPERLARLESVLVQSTPLDAGLDRELLTYIKSQPTARAYREAWEQALARGEDPEAATRDEPWMQFLERLAAHRRKDVRFYGRYGLCQIRFRIWQQKWSRAKLEFGDEARQRGLQLIHQSGPVIAEKRPELGEELRAIEEEFRQLLEMAKAQGWDETVPSHSFTAEIRDIEHIRRTQMEHPVPRPESEPPAMLAPRAIAYTPDKRPSFEITGTIPFTIKTLDGQSRPVEDKYWPRLHHRWGSAYRWSINTTWYPIVNWRQCTADMDVLYHDLAILVMRTPGVAREILSRTDAVFLDVRWDGRNFWVVTKNAGVWIISTDGHILKTIGADQGLPPYDQQDQLYPYAEGKAIMAGSFGETYRGWCAMIDAASEQPVNVFFQATAVYKDDVHPPPGGTLDKAFRPTFIGEHRSGGSGPDVFLVGRDTRYGPLLINRETLEVAELTDNGFVRDSLNPVSPRGGRIGVEFHFYSEGGKMIIPNSSISGSHQLLRPPGVEIWSRPFEQPGEQNQPLRICDGGGRSRRIVPSGKWLYVPSSVQGYRICPVTYEQQRLYEVPGKSARGALPAALRPSAHYGLITTTVRGDGIGVYPFRQIIIRE
jgi:hypothetical protein